MPRLAHENFKQLKQAIKYQNNMIVLYPEQFQSNWNIYLWAKDSSTITG